MKTCLLLIIIADCALGCDGTNATGRFKRDAEAAYETLNPFCFISELPVAEKLKYVLYNWKYPKGVGFNRYSARSMNKWTKTVIIAQGWLESELISPWMIDLKNAYLTHHRNCDVINLDWTYYAQAEFLTSSCTTPHIGVFLGRFLAELVYSGFDVKKFHLIGFSLGGQLVAFAAQEVYRLTSVKVGKITGLDVVGLGFNKRDNDRKLSPDDADDVIGIHTNTLFNGILLPYGRVDFYVNNGFFQPLCVLNLFAPEFDFIEILKKLICSHLSATALQIRMVRGEKFVAQKCPLPFPCQGNKAVLRENVDSKLSGVYFMYSDVIKP